MSPFLGLSLICLAIGARGFTSRGLPLTASRRLIGGRGRAVGAACLLAGMLAISLSFWSAAPVERESMRTFCFGTLAGIALAYSVIISPRLEGE